MIIGVARLLLVTLAYQMYNHILQKERRGLAPEILRLTEDLMQKCQR